METKIAEVKADMKKIMVHIMGRLVLATIVSAIMIFGAYVANGDMDRFRLITGITIAIALIYVLYPLRNKNEVLEFYSGKVVCGTKVLTFNAPNEICWQIRETYLAGKRKIMYTRIPDKNVLKTLLTGENEIDVTYMQDPKAQFFKVYMNK